MTIVLWIIGAYLFGLGCYHTGKHNGYGQAILDRIKRDEEMKKR